MRIPTLITCATLLLACVYEPPETPAQPTEWVRYDAAHQFTIDFPRPPLFREFPVQEGLVSYSLSTLHNDTLFHLTYTDHATDITPVLAYHTAMNLPGVYNAKLSNIAGRSALNYSHIDKTLLSHAVLVVVGKRMYVLSVASKRVIDLDGWAQFKQSFHVDTP